ncbi:MAG: T9SS type A sorting domain-containing protein [Hymenobacteraceae bacterium]|nr:T9SS type A sorting domain-containing protein [Hymenobacteraceae bacterium]
MRTAPLALPAEQVETGFQLLPNPATSTVQLALLAGRSTQVELLDFTGRLLRVYPLTQDQTAAALDLRGLPAGLYVVRVGNLTRRLVVE